ncbi:hypothetical protein [Fibrella forsythiae]|uniref:Uncharacterized protein n=1 Tax=Fibrella forsythiae TaxID=2817061 RepID=A0ABS3JH84_9BACT|nr:hypothetical protein [Fibrella forsythiae]MBO0949369.1 hypothetical protein [Fibrella forsythiae]
MLPIETESPHILLLRIGYEGGLVELYTQTLDLLAPVWRESNEMSFNDNDDEIWVERRMEYADFNAYWQDFTSRERWFYGRPLVIHPAIRTHVRRALDQVRSLPYDYGQPERFRYVARWQKALPVC